MNVENHSNRIRFRLAISVEEYLAYYQGRAQVVVARSEDNRTIRFPASAIRKFVTRDGIFGRFEISLDENNKLIAIRPVDQKSARSQVQKRLQVFRVIIRLSVWP